MVQWRVAGVGHRYGKSGGAAYHEGLLSWRHGDGQGRADHGDVPRRSVVARMGVSADVRASLGGAVTVSSDRGARHVPRGVIGEGGSEAIAPLLPGVHLTVAVGIAPLVRRRVQRSADGGRERRRHAGRAGIG